MGTTLDSISSKQKIKKELKTLARSEQEKMLLISQKQI